MRQPDFPFAKFRDWGETPQNVPEIDLDDLRELSVWQSSIFKRPMTDEITGDGYGFHPSRNGANSYVTRAHAKQFAGKTALSMEISEDEFKGRKARQPLHIAKSVELATALFWTVSSMREENLENALSSAFHGDTPDEDNHPFAADAIADYGFCLTYPFDKDVRGVDHGSGLRAQVDRIAPGIGNQMLQFGLLAGDEPWHLKSETGIALMQAVLEEQKRRVAFWAPRHAAILEAFPDTELSQEVLLHRIPLKEAIDLSQNKNRLT